LILHLLGHFFADFTELHHKAYTVPVDEYVIRGKISSNWRSYFIDRSHF